MKRTGKKPVIFIVVALIAALTYLAFFGIHNYYGDKETVYIKGANDIRWGIDISGGVEAVFAPDIDGEVSKEDMDAAKEVISTRLLYENITDSETFVDYDNNLVIVRFPWEADDTDHDPSATVESLGEMAVVSFKLEDGSVVLQGKDDIDSAQVGYNEQKGYDVELKLTSLGASKFATATAANIGKSISIYLDETLISSPTVESAITGGNAIITGNFTMESAQDLANKINAGALPFALTVDQSKLQVVSPTYGSSALSTMLLAGIIAFALICVIMIVFYRLPGAIACICLIGQVGGIIACISGFFPGIPSFTLTVPGIAGIILSIGMGVDANVVTNERIKEEFRAGKTIDGAIRMGYSNAWSAILDGNVTNIIVSIVLMAAFGNPDGFMARAFSFLFPFLSSSITGSIYSFGYTLLIGALWNFIMGVLASRLMMTSISRFKPFRNPKLYGGAKVDA